ncbi:hypothetical protein OROHE_000529 [Orobanche hederae]
MRQWEDRQLAQSYRLGEASTFKQATSLVVHNPPPPPPKDSPQHAPPPPSPADSPQQDPPPSTSAYSPRHATTSTAQASQNLPVL